jgi:hypothetical protein
LSYFKALDGCLFDGTGQAKRHWALARAGVARPGGGLIGLSGALADSGVRVTGGCSDIGSLSAEFLAYGDHGPAQWVLRCNPDGP